MNEELMANSVLRRGVQFAALPQTRKQTIPRTSQTPDGIELAVPRQRFRVTRKRSVCGFHTLCKSVNPRTRELASGQWVTRTPIFPSPRVQSTRATWSMGAFRERSGFDASEATGFGA
jgi:hypothetical protein